MYVSDRDELELIYEGACLHEMQSSIQLHKVQFTRQFNGEMRTYWLSWNFFSSLAYHHHHHRYDILR